MEKAFLEKNYTIEFYRFLFTCIIFVLHFRSYGEFDSDNGNFNGGYLSVEFFFILAGFLMAKKVDTIEARYDSIEKESFYFLMSRYKKLFPNYFLSIIILLIVQFFLYDDFNLKSELLNGFPELLALQIFWSPVTLNLQLWFVSGLLWASFLIYYCLLKNRNFYVYIFAPISLLFYIGWAYYNVGHIDITCGTDIFLGAFFRAFAEIGFGCTLYYIWRNLVYKKIKLNPIIMTLFEIVLLSVIIIIMWRTRHDYKDFIMVFLLALLVVISFIEQGYLSKILNNKVSGFLGSISFTMYVNQLSFQSIVKHFFPSLPFWPVTIITIIALMLFSYIVTLLLKGNRTAKVEN